MAEWKWSLTWAHMIKPSCSDNIRPRKININLFEKSSFTHGVSVFEKVFQSGPVHLLGNDALDGVDKWAWVVEEFHEADYERTPLIPLILLYLVNCLPPSRRKVKSASSFAVLKSLWWQIGIVLILTFVFGPRNYYTPKNKRKQTRLVLTNVNGPWLKVIDCLSRVTFVRYNIRSI